MAENQSIKADLETFLGHFFALSVTWRGSTPGIREAMASQLGINGMPFAITVMVGASCSFISPMGYQTNLMVYEPGGYKFTDFVKIGVPLTIVVGIVTLIIAPLVFPF